MSITVECSSISLSHVSIVVAPVTADELIAAVASLTTARSIPVSAPFTKATLLAGIEIAAAQRADERCLRKAWRDRHGGGSTPLLIVTDSPTKNGCAAVLGPNDAAGPLRQIEIGALSAALNRVAALPRLEAVRELAAELERLDQAGIPGLKVRGLVTLHTLDSRLRTDPERWPRAADNVTGVSPSNDWRAVLTGLGYSVERQPQRGYLLRHDGRPVAVVHPKADPTELSRLDQEGRPPEGVLLNDCAAVSAPFGMLAAGGRIRLFRADPGGSGSTSQYLDVDISALQVDDRPFLALLGPEYLAEGGFDALTKEAATFGAGLRKRLDETIRQRVFPALALAFREWSEAKGLELGDDETRQELERAALTLIFRVLFLLYAESAGYLPVDHATYRQKSLSALVDEAAQASDSLSGQSTALWDQFQSLVKAMRHGNPAWGVPPYNGALFADDGFEGSVTLESMSLADPQFAEVLVGLGRDADSDRGVDYSTLEIGHLGHIYESLLALRLSIADTPLRYDRSVDRYVKPGTGEEPEIDTGGLVWQTNAGGRKGGGVYYTRSELVRHLVSQAVVPAFEQHLDQVRELAMSDPGAAAERLFDFAVLDPACGSAHFLVEVVGALADLVVKFLAETPLPAIHAAIDHLRAGATQGVPIDDIALLRRLVMKRCVFGVDVSPMGAEVAKMSLWLASFVPGVSLAYLGRNVIVGNSLIGVARIDELSADNSGAVGLLEDRLAKVIADAAETVTMVAESDDSRPEDVTASEKADDKAHLLTAGLATVFDLLTAEGFGLTGARDEAILQADRILDGRANGMIEKARELARQHSFLHWPIEFPRVFAREKSGFDAVVGNPPWEEVTVERLAWYARIVPGIRSLPQDAREAAIYELIAERPDLPDRFAEEQADLEEERSFLRSTYPSMRGDPDLYKFFCRRYEALLRDGGCLGVVLPRSAFSADGSEGFREWLFEGTTPHRLDFLLNSGGWAFDSHPQYTVALVAAERNKPDSDWVPEIAGVAKSLDEFKTQAARPGIRAPYSSYGSGYRPPLVRSEAEADLLAKIMTVGSPFPLGGGRWMCFPVRELDETNDRKLWRNADEGWPLWKGESFDQYDPNGAEARICPDNAAVRKKVHKPRPGSESMVKDKVSLADRKKAVVNEVGRARVAFRDVTNRTNSRTVIACLVPPETFLTNKAPYLVFAAGGDADRAACLGLMNSLVFDWQARRFVETNMNYFILEGLVIPSLSDDDFDVINDAAARLSCIDDRYVDFGNSVGVKCGPLDDDERAKLRAEIDAQVASAWGLSESDIDLIFKDFTFDAVPASYRERVLKRFAEIA